jgi:cyclophilin family peptidyl-prolyl cis-trans isomerase
MIEPEATCAVIDALAALRYLGAAPHLAPLVRRPPRAVQHCTLAALRKITGQPWEPPATELSRGLPRLSWAGAAALPRKAILVTRRGEIEIELWPEQTPATVANFAQLAARRFYRGLRFHRVVPNFVVQGGDPHGDGWGGPGYTIPCELTPRPYVAGSVGMALAGRDTGGSQFFISLGRHPRLDGRYTQFGRVVRGMEIVRRLLPGDEIKDLYVPRRERDRGSM